MSGYLVDDEFKIPTTSSSLKYDEYDITTLIGKISLPYSYQMFSSDSHRTNDMVVGYLYSDYSTSSNKIFAVNPVNQICFDTLPDAFGLFTLRPVVFVNSNTKISSGNGTITKPYILK